MKSRLLGAVCACVAAFVTATLSAATVQPLEVRLGGKAFYDPNLDISWAKDTGTNSRDTWDKQIQWVETFKLGGLGGWRLPSADVNGDKIVKSCSITGEAKDCADNEMSFLYYIEGITAAKPGKFRFLKAASYWSGTEFVNKNPIIDPSAWGFHFGSGALEAGSKDVKILSWAVHDGDVGDTTPTLPPLPPPLPQPIPAAFWLFGSGLLGLVGAARRKKT